MEFNSSVQSLFYTYDIIRDETCDFQFGRGRQEGVTLFKVDLVLVNSTNPLVVIDFDNSEATVFIDDSMEEECSELLHIPSDICGYSLLGHTCIMYNFQWVLFW